MFLGSEKQTLRLLQTLLHWEATPEPQRRTHGARTQGARTPAPLHAAAASRYLTLRAWPAASAAPHSHLLDVCRWVPLDQVL
jgi:hypothetical protein